MKRLLYGILILVVLLVGVTFTTKNAQVVELNYYFGIHWVTSLVVHDVDDSHDWYCTRPACEPRNSSAHAAPTPAGTT